MCVCVCVCVLSGLSFVAPAFMRREKPGQVKVCSPEETDYEEEQLWIDRYKDIYKTFLEGVMCSEHYPFQSPEETLARFA